MSAYIPATSITGLHAETGDRPRVNLRKGRRREGEGEKEATAAALKEASEGEKGVPDGPEVIREEGGPDVRLTNANLFIRPAETYFI